LSGFRENKAAIIDEVKLQNMISRIILGASGGGAGNFSPILAAAGIPPSAAFEGPSPRGQPERGERREETGDQKKLKPLRAVETAPQKEVQRMEDDELDELDELEELESLEELEGFEDFTSVETVQEGLFAQEPTDPVKDINDLASEIEFEFQPDSEGEAAPEAALRPGVEVVSPFATMLSNFSDTGETAGGESADSEPGVEKKKLTLHYEGKLEDLSAAYHDSCFYRPFLLESACVPEVLDAAGEELESLEPIDLAIERTEGEEPVILEERDGILYISDRILNPPTREGDKKQDPDFKRLLDSIIEKK
jgi:hypothetical protein